MKCWFNKESVILQIILIHTRGVYNRVIEDSRCFYHSLFSHAKKKEIFHPRMWWIEYESMRRLEETCILLYWRIASPGFYCSILGSCTFSFCVSATFVCSRNKEINLINPFFPSWHQDTFTFFQIPAKSCHRKKIQYVRPKWQGGKGHWP